VSDAQVEVLESIARRASKKQANELSDTTQQEYILAEAKARSQEEAMRKVHQKQADKAMDVRHTLKGNYPDMIFLFSLPPPLSLSPLGGEAAACW
jgi:hypothetical protein